MSTAAAFRLNDQLARHCPEPVNQQKNGASMGGAVCVVVGVECRDYFFVSCAAGAGAEAGAGAPAGAGAGAAGAVASATGAASTFSVLPPTLIATGTSLPSFT